jgi:hypothetical protein
VPTEESEIKWATIQKDLASMRYALRPSGTRWEDLRARSAGRTRGQHRSEAIY